MSDWLSEIEVENKEFLERYGPFPEYIGELDNARMARVLRELAGTVALFLHPFNYEWEHLSTDAQELLESASGSQEEG